MPDCPHFPFLEHWNKTTPIAQLISQASHVLFKFKTPDHITSIL
jgi:hypothetical protein